MQSDRELVTSVLEGRTEEFAVLVSRYERLARSVAIARLRDRHAAEDVAQEAFLAAFKSLAALRQPERFGGWLLGIARFQAGRFLRDAPSRTEDIQAFEPFDASASAVQMVAERHGSLLDLVEKLPATREMQYGGRQDETALAWRKHVEQLGARLQAEPPAGRVAILPRERGLTFAVQWPLRTPDGRHWIAPLDVSQDQPMTLEYFVEFLAAGGSGVRRHGSWRLAQDLHDVEIPRADLVYEDGTPWREWAAHVLDRQGLELADVEEPRTLWVAKHDGRKLKPWRAVASPVPYLVEGGVEKKGVVKPGVGFLLRSVTLTGADGLFDHFNRMIDRKNLAADKPWIVDETGLPTPPAYDKTTWPTWEDYWSRESNRTTRQRRMRRTSWEMSHWKWHASGMKRNLE